MLTLDKIYHAAFVLKDVARKTDLIEAPKLSKDCQLYLKTENLQATGSFKVRGAYYKISQLSEEESAKGVIACSAGNPAQGVALAATRRGIRSIVCMPDGAPLMKVENTKNLGAEVCLVPGTYDEAHDKAVQLQKEYDMTFIHPYDDEQVIAGQGTIGLEILDQLPDVDAVVVPVGGGGLISLPAYLISGLPVHNAIATNKMSSTMGTVLATFKFARSGFIPWKLALTCVCFAFAGSSLGARLALLMDSHIFLLFMVVVLPLTAIYVTRGTALFV